MILHTYILLMQMFSYVCIHTSIVTYVYAGKIPCPYDGDYRCPRSGVCIRNYQVCDGTSQCRHGEDEQNCS